MKTFSILRSILAAGLALNLLACGSGDGSNQPSTSDEPKYLAAISTRTADAYVTYSAATPAIDGTIVQHFLKRSVETAGHLYPSSFDGQVFVPQGKAASITKFSANADGTLAEGDTVSFAGAGVTDVLVGPIIGQTMIDAQKAYFFDNANYRALIWNPSSMELTGDAIDFAELLKEPVLDAPGYSPQIFTMPGFVKQVDNLMFVPVRWQNWSAETPDKILYHSAGLLIIDTEKDQVVRLLRDERLIDTIYTVVSDAGDLYLFTGAFGASFNLAFDLGTPSGVLKIRRGQTSFDPDYFLDLEKLTGGRPATTPSRGRGTEVFMKAFYEEEADMYDADGNIKEAILAEPWQLLGKGWRYWRLDSRKAGLRAGD
ncbi:MAG: DUF4374 domain-containing protein [Polyangiaceae bacterium]